LSSKSWEGADLQAYLLYIPISSRTIKKTSFGVLIHQVLLQVPIAAVKRPPHFFQQPILLILKIERIPKMFNIQSTIFNPDEIMKLFQFGTFV
jgi:hypothetical protein